MPTHLPPTELLADYAHGAASPGVSLLVATHLTYAPESRATVDALENVGGVLLADEQPVAMAASALDDVMAKLDAKGGSSFRETVATVTAEGEAWMPATLREALGIGSGDIPWRFRLPGVSEYDLPGFEGEHVSLLRARPGCGIPQHTHEGAELTLVLSGAMADGGMVYEVGDVAVNSEADDHCPRIVGEGTCYCLVVMDGRLRFTGTFSRALNILAE